MKNSTAISFYLFYYILNYRDTGLELSICKLTTQRLENDIWMDKNYKNGARLVFSHHKTEINRNMKKNQLI